MEALYQSLYGCIYMLVCFINKQYVYYRVHAIFTHFNLMYIHLCLVGSL